LFTGGHKEVQVTLSDNTFVTINVCLQPPVDRLHRAVPISAVISPPTNVF